ncbi:hypothetical protein Pmani_015931 [Petrolisthes manimaculis]|uniref:Uncharacterized protein n=1 Tax=Petrolisthes manimaculis TaxID=1843537 RepID=A0AAE1PR82_9EUCA|nr:hypothetical protein Pmani_015931 [Petrolisthes manimaculis]
MHQPLAFLHLCLPVYVCLLGSYHRPCCTLVFVMSPAAFLTPFPHFPYCLTQPSSTQPYPLAPFLTTPFHPALPPFHPALPPYHPALPPFHPALPPFLPAILLPFDLPSLTLLLCITV